MIATILQANLLAAILVVGIWLLSGGILVVERLAKNVPPPVDPQWAETRRVMRPAK